jgi:hypothetical protein
LRLGPGGERESRRGGKRGGGEETGYLSQLPCASYHTVNTSSRENPCDVMPFYVSLISSLIDPWEGRARRGRATYQISIAPRSRVFHCVTYQLKNPTNTEYQRVATRRDRIMIMIMMIMITNHDHYCCCIISHPVSSSH